MAPENASTIDDVVTAISQQPWGATLLVVGDFNTDLDAPEGQDWDEGIAAAMEEELLEDISAHFLPQHKLWLKDGCT